MKTLYYRDFALTEYPAYNLHLALAAAREQKAARLVLDGGVFDIDPVWCDERYLAYSNHGFNGPKRIAALIEDMHDFELDCGGATFLCHGIVTPVAILRSENITVKNLVLDNDRNGFLELRAEAYGPDYTDFEILRGFAGAYRIIHSQLYTAYEAYESAIFPAQWNVEYNGETGEIQPGTGDHTFGVQPGELTFEQIDDRHLRCRGYKRQIPLGNVCVFHGAHRFGAGIFCLDSRRVTVENVTIHGCYGMGFVGQVSEDITLRGFATRRAPGRYHTANADATHFLNCSGTVLVEDSYFEGQYDDALNIHGIYVRVVGRDRGGLLVREMHVEAKDIRMFRPGDRVRAMRPDPLIPYAEKTVETVEYISGDICRLTFAEGAEDIAVGDDLDNITRNPALIFRNNVVKDNRARGMLIATAGRTVIENCYFHSSGTAVKFESDGAYWFESGGTQDVTIEGNRFDGCRYANWGYGVIECQARKEVLPDQYFHGTIRVLNNDFRMVTEDVARMNNVENFLFSGNRITPVAGGDAVVSVAHVGHYDVQSDVTLKNL